ncbi:MAG: hypothetical protein KTR25_06305 [Myxococcales bacterium]|nr:hypothetical protein [Myxococcales bacterium]
MLLVTLGALLSGCASAFTSIERQDDGTYMLTKVDSYFGVYTGSTFYQCEEKADKLMCKQRN